MESESETKPSPALKSLEENLEDTTPASQSSLSSDASDLFSDILSAPEESRRSGVKWIVGSGVLLAVGLSGWWGYSSFLKKTVVPIAIPTLSVQKGSIEVTITESGTVELGGQQTFKSPGDVTVEAVEVEERQQIEAGAVMLVLRDRTLEGNLSTQQIETQKAENMLARKQEIVQEQQAKLQTAQDRLKDSQSLFDRGFISEDAYRQDQQAVDDVISALKDAQVELTNAELDVNNAQLTLENTRTQLSDNQIVSPIDAVVLNVVAKPGDGVKQEGELLTIGDPSKETVRLQLATLSAAKVNVNMPVHVSMIGPNPKVFTGRISRVSPQAVSAAGGVDPFQGGGEQPGKVEAEAILDTPSNGGLIPGVVASVEIVLNQRKLVVAVPLTAIQTEGDRQFVWLKDKAGKAQKQSVKVGLQNLESAEITSGLKVGDEIAADLPPEIGTPLAEAAPPGTAIPDALSEEDPIP
jgi:HlyD family secretion protein